MKWLLGNDLESKRFQKAYTAMWDQFIRCDGKYTNQDVTNFINSLSVEHKDEIIRLFIMKEYMEHAKKSSTEEDTP